VGMLSLFLWPHSGQVIVDSKMTAFIMMISLARLGCLLHDGKGGVRPYADIYYNFD